MANELRQTISIVYANGQLKDTYAPGAINLPQATAGIDKQTVSATSVDTAITFTNLTVPGIVCLQSLEPTTTGGIVDWGPQSSTGSTILPLGSLYPKQLAILGTMNSTTTLRIKRTAAGTTKVLITAYEA